MLSPQHQLKPEQIKAKTGQSLAEYGLLLALVSIVAIEGLHLLGGAVSSQFQQLAIAMRLQPTNPAFRLSPNAITPPVTAISANDCQGNASTSGCAIQVNSGF